MTPDLRVLLADAYSAQVLRRGSLTAAQARLKDALRDPVARASVQRRLSEIDALDRQTGGRLRERDYVASVHRGLLRDALG